MVLIGIMMLSGKMNAFTGYVSNVDNTNNVVDEEVIEEQEEEQEKDQENSQEELVDAPKIVLNDQFGVEHKLEDYKGKVVFLNFWATWCPPCKAEMPDIQKLYEKYQGEDSDVVVLGIAAPGLGKEKSKEEIADFLEENGYTYPVLMDVDGRYFNELRIMSYPTTYMITKEGKIFGYVSGAITEDIMEDIINQTREEKRAY